METKTYFKITFALLLSVLFSSCRKEPVLKPRTFDSSISYDIQGFDPDPPQFGNFYFTLDTGSIIPNYGGVFRDDSTLFIGLYKEGSSGTEAMMDIRIDEEDQWLTFNFLYNGPNSYQEISGYSQGSSIDYEIILDENEQPTKLILNFIVDFQNGYDGYTGGITKPEIGHLLSLEIELETSFVEGFTNLKSL